MRALTVLAISFAAGAVPFAQVAARSCGVDLRRHRTGTVSGSGLFEVAGLRPLVVAGLCDCAKGAVGPLLAGRRPGLAALSGAAAVAAHNWSPLLGGSGGRGISPALGALTVTAPAGAGVLLGSLAAGRAARQTGVGALAGYVALVPVLRRTNGRAGAVTGAAVLTPILLKRLAGNRPAAEPRVYLWRLLFDRDTRKRAR